MNSNAGKSYYGPFFWLTVVSFAVPVVVAVKGFEASRRPYTKPEPKPDACGVDHRLWDYLLKMYVENGLVDYQGIKRDHLFQTYLRQLGRAQPDKLDTDNDRLALLCNAYNALVINGVIKHEITQSVDKFSVKKVRFFDLKEHIFAGRTLSLNHLEHKLIRTEFPEPRVHMALVCAARSCPVIRAEAYHGKTLPRQLEDQARQFANNPKHVGYDAPSNTLHLSKILEWYGDDFKAAGGYRKFLADRVADPTLRKALLDADGSVKIVFNDYNWSLNSREKRAKGSGAGKGKTDFGSGSVPNE